MSNITPDDMSRIFKNYRSGVVTGSSNQMVYDPIQKKFVKPGSQTQGDKLIKFTRDDTKHW